MELATSARRGRIWDVLGITLSGACVVHCLAMPLLATWIAGRALEGDASHRWLLAALVPTALVAFVRGLRAHRRWRIAAVALAGLGCVVTGTAAPHALVGPVETPLTVTGSVLLIAAHAWNHKTCRGCRRSAVPVTGPAREELETPDRCTV